MNESASVGIVRGFCVVVVIDAVVDAAAEDEDEEGKISAGLIDAVLLRGKEKSEEWS